MSRTLSLAVTLVAVIVVQRGATHAAPAPATTTSTTTTATTAPATTQSTAAALYVQTVRVTRSNANTEQLQKRFGQRFYSSDGTAGVTLQLILRLADGLFLPMPREAVVLETFIDDTYENLLVGPVENRSFAQPPAVSTDGRELLFTTMSARAPADDATRVFVRGSVHARLARGEEVISKAPLRLRAGEKVEVGPFRATLRSIIDSEQNLQIAIDVRSGDAARIRQMRLLSKEGRRLNTVPPSNRDERYEASGMTDPNTTFHAILPPGQEEVTLEFTHVERLENVRIPFEAMVDVSHARAGPIESFDRGGGAAGAGAVGRVENVRERPWPPPPLPPGAAASSQLPASAGRFDPDARPTTAPSGKSKLDGASVDLFALTINKPAPGEVEGVAWSSAPARAFAAGGYTLARLMLTTPDVSIASVTQDGISITRFEDDKVGKLDATVYRDTLTRGGERAVISPDGQQALVHVTLAAAPSPGATRCTLAGTIKAKVAVRERIDAGEPVAPEKGERTKVGPITIHFAEVRPEPVTSPVFTGRPTVNLSLIVNGPTNTVRSLDFINAETGRWVAGHNLFAHFDENRVAYGNSVSFSLALQEPKPDKVIVRLRHFEKLDEVTVPFEITTGIGL